MVPVPQFIEGVARRGKWLHVQTVPQEPTHSDFSTGAQRAQLSGLASTIGIACGASDRPIDACRIDHGVVASIASGREHDGDGPKMIVFIVYTNISQRRVCVWNRTARTGASTHTALPLDAGVANAIDC